MAEYSFIQIYHIFVSLLSHSFGLLPLPGYCETCSHEHSCTILCVNIVFLLLFIVYLIIEMLGYLITLCLILSNCKLLLKWLHCFTFPLAMHDEDSKFSTSVYPIFILKCLQCIKAEGKFDGKKI